MKAGDPLPPVLVKMFKTEDPDPAIQSKMEKLETQRNDLESKMFKKAVAELALITAQTLQELEANIEMEMMPFFVASVNNMADVKAAVQSGGKGLTRFLEKDDQSKFQANFPFLAFQFKKLQKNSRMPKMQE